MRLSPDRGLVAPLLTLALTMVAGPAISRAQPAPAPVGDDATDPEKGEARELMQLGVKLVKSGDHLGALAVFKDAYKRFPNPKILLNIGTTLKLLDRTSEAVNAYQRYADAPEADPERRRLVLEEIAKLEASLARLEITAPAEAEIQVGTEDWIPASVARLHRIAPGPYVVRARREGFQPWSRSGEAAANDIISIAIELVPEPEPTETKVYITVPGERAEPRSRLGALLRGHFDVGGGAAALVGGTFDITERLHAQAAGIVGANFGGFVSGSYSFLTGTLRPQISAGVPVFFNDGARVGVRAAAGLEIVANRHLGVLIEAGVEYNFNPQDRVEFGGMLRSVSSVAFIPALAVTGRL